VRIASLAVVIAGTDDLLEALLERCATDEETVNVGLADQHSSVGISDGATVEDSDFLSGFLRNVLGQPCADGLVGLLSLLGGSNLASADGPDGLVSDDDLGPVVNFLSDGSELSGVNFVSLVRLTLINLLTDAGHDGETVAQSELGLLGNNFVSLTKDVATLAVSENDPVDLGIDEHLSAEFTGVCAIVEKGGILSGDLNLGASKSSLHGGEVEGGWGNNDFDLGGVEVHSLEDISGEFLSEVKSAIALPVAADEVSSHYVGRLDFNI